MAISRNLFLYQVREVCGKKGVFRGNPQAQDIEYIFNASTYI
jgi:hypothetical protein